MLWFTSAAKVKINERKTAKRHEREDARIDRGKAALADVKASLASKPHPTPNRAECGDTLLDWVEWMFAHAGRKGMIEACKVIEKADAADIDTEAAARMKRRGDAIILLKRIREIEAEALKVRNAARYRKENGWLLDVLVNEHRGAFVEGMIDHLRKAAIEDLPDRAISILIDIYAKAHGRRGSKKYLAAEEEFERRAGLVEAIDD